MLPQTDLREIRRIDLGCGKPEQKYAGCFGIDINPDYHPDLLHNVDEGLPFEDGQIEFIHCDNALEHVRNPHFVLRECLRTLRDGGELLLVVPNCQYLPLIGINMVYDLNRFWHWYMNLPFKKERSIHWTLYTKHLITQVAEDAGFQVVDRRGRLYSKEITLRLRKPAAGELPTTIAGPRAP
jgi:predicted SAM-dependent methyltransferase